MIRRIGLAGASLCAFLFPACMNTKPWGSAEPFWVDAKTGIVIPDAANPVASGNSTKLPGTTVARVPSPYNRNQPSIADGRATPILVREPDEVEPRVVTDAPSGTQGRMLPDLENPRQGSTSRSLAFPVARRQEETPIVTPPWPNLGGTATAETTPPLTSGPTVKPAPTPSIQPLDQPRQSLRPVPPVEPPTLPPLESTRTVGGIAHLPEPTATDSILVKALRAFEKQRPDEAINHLRQLDPTNQDVLMYLMPIMVRLSEGGMQSVPPEELAALTDRLQQATLTLKNKAALRSDRICFCRAVRKFGDVDAYDAKHEFRPGDMVHLYVELKNFTCVSETSGVQNVSQPSASRKTCSIWTETRLEIRDSQGRAVCRFDDLPKKVRVETAPQEFYHTYRFCVPENLTSGVYTLWVTVSDKNKPDGGGMNQAIELRVGRN